jgi:hypothetical protein
LVAVGCGHHFRSAATSIPADFASRYIQCARGSRAPVQNFPPSSGPAGDDAHGARPVESYRPTINISRRWPAGWCMHACVPARGRGTP